MVGIRSRRKAERPGEILEAAFAEFVTHGYSSTRLEDVAARVGISKGTIYFYFGSKERLFEQAVLTVGSRPLATLVAEPTLVTGELAADVRAFLSELYMLIDANPQLGETLRLLVAEARRFPRAVQDYFATYMDPVLDRLRKRLAVAAAAGEITQELAYGAEAVAAPPFAYLVMSLLFPDRRGVSAEALLDSQVELLLGSLTGSSGAAAAGPGLGEPAPPGRRTRLNPTNLLARTAPVGVHWLGEKAASKARAVGRGAASRRFSAVDLVVMRIRSLIREQGLVVGDALPTEAELAAGFGASRNTVREAVRTLKAFGVLESRQKVGAVLIDNRRAAMTDLVSTAMEVSTDMFLDIQGFRRLTEMNLGEQVVGRLGDECVEEMALANRAMAAATDPVEAAGFDFRFHMLLVEAAGNKTLAEIYGMLQPVICRLMEAGKSQRPALREAAVEHDNILRALREGDRIGFVYHMDRHLDAGLQFIPASASAVRGTS